MPALTAQLARKPPAEERPQAVSDRARCEDIERIVDHFQAEGAALVPQPRLQASGEMRADPHDYRIVRTGGTADGMPHTGRTRQVLPGPEIVRYGVHFHSRTIGAPPASADRRDILHARGNSHALECREVAGPEF